MRVKSVYLNEYFRLTPGQDYAAAQPPVKGVDGEVIGHVVSAIARADGRTIDLELEVDEEGWELLVKDRTPLRVSRPRGVAEALHGGGTVSEVVGRDTHDCLRDELPEFMGYGARRAPQHDAGDIVQCSCGEYWLCLDGGFARYKRLSRRKALRLISRKENDAASA